MTPMREPGRVAPMLLVASALALAAGPAGSQPSWRLTTTLESDTAWRVRSPRRIQKSQNRVELDLELELGSSFELRSRGRLLYDPAARLVGAAPDFGQRPFDRWQVSGSRHLEAELRELTLDWRGRVGSARVDLRVGKQQVVWGQSFGLRVLDLVNAQDFREFILDEFVDARTPAIGVRLDATLGRVAVQALAFPDFEPDVLADPESEFALEPELPGFLPPARPLPDLPGVAGPAALVALGGPDRPGDWDLSSWGFGLRVASRWRGLDFSLHYWDRFDPRPAFRRRVVALPVPGFGSLPLNLFEAKHFRVRTLGWSCSVAWRDFVVWSEGGVSDGAGFVTTRPGDGDGLVRRPDLQYALGLDWTGYSRLFANLQLIQFVVLDHDRHVEADAFRTFVSLLLRFDYRNETVFPQLFVLYGTRERDSMIRPSLELRLTDRLTLGVGADLFTGPRRGLLGQYARRRDCIPVPAGLPLPGAGGCVFDPPPGRTSRVFLRLRYSFGLGSRGA